MAKRYTMRMIGLIGGLSWESTAQYYRIINQKARKMLGGVHSARCLVYSFDFGEVERSQAAGDWEAATEMMGQAARSLERGGADLLLICSNTMHKMADEVAASVSVPLLHIADPTGEAIRASGMRTVGLLGTSFTMEQEFYRGRLQERFGLEVLIPEAGEIGLVHQVIYEELVRGVVAPESRAGYQEVMANLVSRGAQAIILGCTEIMLLIKPGDCPVPLFDTTTLHAEAALGMALRD